MLSSHPRFTLISVFYPLVRPSVRPSVRPPIRPSAHPSVRPSAHPSVRPSAHPSVRPSVRPPIRPSVRPSAHPSVSAFYPYLMKALMALAVLSNNILFIDIIASIYCCLILTTYLVCVLFESFIVR